MSISWSGTASTCFFSWYMTVVMVMCPVMPTRVEASFTIQSKHNRRNDTAYENTSLQPTVWMAQVISTPFWPTSHSHQFVTILKLFKRHDEITYLPVHRALSGSLLTGNNLLSGVSSIFEHVLLTTWGAIVHSCMYQLNLVSQLLYMEFYNTYHQICLISQLLLQLPAASCLLFTCCCWPMVCHVTYCSAVVMCIDQWKHSAIGHKICRGILPCEKPGLPLSWLYLRKLQNNMYKSGNNNFCPFICELTLPWFLRIPLLL